MHLAVFSFEGKPSLGVVRGKNIVPVPGLTLREAIAGGPAVFRELSKSTNSPIPLASVAWLAPHPIPDRNILCVGLNYADHVKESSEARGKPTKTPSVPVFFTKGPHAVNGPYADIPFDASVSAELDWEVELGVVIGRRGKNIPAEKAMEYVFGYTVINDVSARDLQVRHIQFFKGKSLDGNCPMGPYIVTADEIADPHNLALRCRMNGVVKQDANTSQMIFKIPALIASLSVGQTLEPGDVIATGTPAGVGFSRTPPEFLKPGDVVECEIEGIGTIRNRVALIP